MKATQDDPSRNPRRRLDKALLLKKIMEIAVPDDAATPGAAPDAIRTEFPTQQPEGTKDPWERRSSRNY